MIAGLKRCIYPPMAVLAAVVALTAAILALHPGVAEAQEEQGATALATAPAHRGVVAPGDSLWSISQERLGPSASPQQIALDVRRIHEINRNQIGDDPDLIFPGQRLALPPPAGTSAAEAPANRPSGPAARTAVAAAGGAPEQAARPATERAAEPIARPPALPERVAVPEARSLPSRAVPGGGLDIPADERRRLLGLGIIIALTLVLAGLMAWRLRLRRDVGDAEAWGLYPGYYHHNYYDPHGEERYDHHDHQQQVAIKLDRGHPGSTNAYSLDLRGKIVAAKKRGMSTAEVARAFGVGLSTVKRYAKDTDLLVEHEPGRNGAAGSLHKGLAVAHNPLVRRALRHAPRGASTPGRPLREDRPVLAQGTLRRAARSAVVRRRSARRRAAAGLARGRNR